MIDIKGFDLHWTHGYKPFYFCSLINTFIIFANGTLELTFGVQVYTDLPLYNIHILESLSWQSPCTLT